MNADSLTDKQLVERVRAGSPDRYAQLVERYIAPAHAIARARLGNAAETEDAVQEAFVRAYERLNTLRDPAKFGPWVLTIARHEAVRLAVARAKSAELDDSKVSASQDAPDVAQREMNGLLRDHVMRLPETSREVLLLHYFAGKSAREIATLLEVRRTAVLKRLQRAREQLAETLLRDLEIARPSEASVTKQIARITAVTSAIAIEHAASGGAAVAATGWNGLGGLTALFPKAATLAAAAAGMAFTAAIGWMYLSGQTPKSDGAVNETPAATTVAQSGETPPSSIEPAASEAQSAPGAVATIESTPPTSIVMAQAATETTASAHTESLKTFLTATGTWDVSIILAGTHEEHMGAVTITDLGTVLRIVPAEEELAPFYHECRREGSTIVLTMNDSDATGTLRGSFEAGFTKLTLDGSIQTRNGPDPEPVAMEIQLVATRIEPNTLSRADRVRMLREQIETFNRQLQRFYVGTGSYPDTMEALTPVYISDLTPYRSTETRTVEYSPPSEADDPAIQALTRAAMEVTSGEELAAIETQLIPLWGDKFMNAAAILDVRDTEINVHLRLRAIGRIDEVVDFDDAKVEASDAMKQARAQAQIASCQNNMKQLALVMRLFEAEHAAGLWPAGWRMTYPDYMADTRILTCPGDEPGTESYEILFPGPNTEWLLALGRQLEGLSEDAPETQVSDVVPVAIEKHHCSGLDGRNVVYMDGHVERIDDARWDAVVAPYLEYR